MAEYKLSVSKKASKELEKLPDTVLKKLYAKLTQLPQNPFPTYSKKLKGSAHTYRIREGDYRVIYEIEDLEIIIMSVGHRREIYR